MSEAEAARWKAFGTWLEGQIKRLGLPNVEVATLAGMSISSLNTLRAGGRTYKGDWQLPSPSDRMLMRLATAVRVAPELLFDQAGRALPPWAMDDAFDNADNLEALRDIADKKVGAANDQLLVAGLVENLSKLPPARRKKVIDFLQDLFAEEESADA